MWKSAESIVLANVSIVERRSRSPCHSRQSQPFLLAFSVCRPRGLCSIFRRQVRIETPFRCNQCRTAGWRARGRSHEDSCGKDARRHTRGCGRNNSWKTNQRL